MDEYESLSHSKWECKYHVVFIPKSRRKALYGDLRKYLGEVLKWPPAGGQEHRGRVSDPAQPLRAAHKLKPPALPGDTYFIKGSYAWITHDWAEPEWKYRAFAWDA